MHYRIPYERGHYALTALRGRVLSRSAVPGAGPLIWNTSTFSSALRRSPADPIAVRPAARCLSAVVKS